MVKTYAGKDIIKAPNGVYRIYWKDKSVLRKYCCKNYSIISFFGTIKYIDLNEEGCCEIEKIVLIAEGT